MLVILYVGLAFQIWPEQIWWFIGALAGIALAVWTWPLWHRLVD